MYVSLTPLGMPADGSGDAAAPPPHAAVADLPLGIAFRPPDAGAGPWKNYRVTMLGGVAADEDCVLWPNQADAQLGSGGAGVWRSAIPPCMRVLRLHAHPPPTPPPNHPPPPPPPPGSP